MWIARVVLVTVCPVAVVEIDSSVLTVEGREEIRVAMVFGGPEYKRYMTLWLRHGIWECEIRTSRTSRLFSIVG
jgi:hypothetical protein